MHTSSTEDLFNVKMLNIIKTCIKMLFLKSGAAMKKMHFSSQFLVFNSFSVSSFLELLLIMTNQYQLPFPTVPLSSKPPLFLQQSSERNAFSLRAMSVHHHAARSHGNEQVSGFNLEGEEGPFQGSPVRLQGRFIITVGAQKGPMGGRQGYYS